MTRAIGNLYPDALFHDVHLYNSEWKSQWSCNKNQEIRKYDIYYLLSRYQWRYTCIRKAYKSVYAKEWRTSYQVSHEYTKFMLLPLPSITKWTISLVKIYNLGNYGATSFTICDIDLIAKELKLFILRPIENRNC